MSILSDALENHMAEHKLTIKQLATKLDVSPPAVTRWILHLFKPRKETLTHINKVLGIDLQQEEVYVCDMCGKWDIHTRFCPSCMVAKTKRTDDNRLDDLALKAREAGLSYGTYVSLHKDDKF